MIKSDSLEGEGYKFQLRNRKSNLLSVTPIIVFTPQLELWPCSSANCQNSFSTTIT